MKTHITIISLLFCCLSSFAYNSNMYSSLDIGVIDGMSSNTVFKIVKGDDGFIWIATRHGIDMYDGISFKHYEIFKYSLKTIFDGQKILIYKSPNGILWAFTDSGRIFYYDKRSDSFVLYLNTYERLPGALLNSILQINDKLYLSLSDGIACIDVKTKRILYKKNSDIGVNVLIPYNGNILAGTADGIVETDYSLKHSFVLKSSKHKDVITLLYDKQSHGIWAGCNGHGVFFMSEDNNSEQDIIPSAVVRSIKRLNNNTILVGCDGKGVYKINTDNKKARAFASDDDNQECLISSTSVYDIEIDEGNIWISTYNGGMTLLRNNNIFKLIKNKNARKKADNYARSIIEDQNRHLWVAYDTSLNCYDINTGSCKSYLDGIGLLTMTIDNYGWLWAGSYGKGVFRVNTKTGQIIHYNSLSGNSTSDCVYSLYKDNNGNIWSGGLNFNLRCLKVTSTGFKSKMYNINQVYAICSINKDSMLVGTSRGFSIIDIKSGKVTSFLEHPDRLGLPGTSFANCVAATNNRYLWIGTDGGGLLCYDLKSRRISAYTTQNGLPSNYIMSIVYDGNNKLWISTENSGIFIFDIKRRMVETIIKRNEGLSFNEYYSNSSRMLRNGNLVFGGHGGVVMFSPVSLSFKSKLNIIYTGVFVGSRKVSMVSDPDILKQPLNNIDVLNLPYNERTLSIKLCTNDLYNQSAQQLRYKLNGYSDEWKLVGASQVISFSNLTPGKYVLEISAIGNPYYNSVKRYITIYVEQSLWLRWYMLLAYLAVLLLFAYWALKTYKSNLENKQSNEKINFFINVAHDIRTPISLVLAPIEKLYALLSSDENGESRYLANTAIRNIRKLQEMVSQLTDFNKIDSSNRSLSMHSVNIDTQLNNLCNAYYSLAESKNLTLKLETDDNDCCINTDTSLLYRVLNNLLSNAFKYTLKGSISIITSITEDFCVIEFRDTGIGISQKSSKMIFHQYHRGDNVLNNKIAGFGIGLYFTYRLVHKLDGKLTFTSKLDEGTSFFLSLPLAKRIDISNKNEDNVEEQNLLVPDLYEPDAIKSSYKEKILFVEDNDELRHFLSYMLSTHYKVTCAESAEKALEILKDYSFDLIISDIMMPGMNGDALCKYLKTHIETSHIPVILLTAKADKNSIVNGLDTGADDYITKPFDIDVLTLKIRNMFASRKEIHRFYLTRMHIDNTSSSATDDENKINKDDLDELFLKNVKELIVKNMSNSDFSINDICTEMAMSRTLLYEKIKKLVGLAPNDLVKNFRMEMAKQLLADSNITVTDVAYKCGFTDSRYFSTVFKKHYGVSPSKFNE